MVQQARTVQQAVAANQAVAAHQQAAAVPARGGAHIAFLPLNPGAPQHQGVAQGKEHLGIATALEQLAPLVTDVTTLWAL